VPLIRSVTGTPVFGGTGVDGVETGSGAAGWTALARGAVVASRPTEPKRDRKARREEEPRGASVPGPLFLLVSSDIVSVFGSRCSGKLVLRPKTANYSNGSSLSDPLVFPPAVEPAANLSRTQDTIQKNGCCRDFADPIGVLRKRPLAPWSAASLARPMVNKDSRAPGRSSTGAFYLILGPTRETNPRNRTRT